MRRRARGPRIRAAARGARARDRRTASRPGPRGTPAPRPRGRAPRPGSPRRRRPACGPRRAGSGRSPRPPRPRRATLTNVPDRPSARSSLERGPATAPEHLGSRDGDPVARPAHRRRAARARRERRRASRRPRRRADAGKPDVLVGQLPSRRIGAGAGRDVPLARAVRRGASRRSARGDRIRHDHGTDGAARWLRRRRPDGARPRR